MAAFIWLKKQFNKIKGGSGILFKTNIIEFLFNENKYRLEKFVLMLLFGFVVTYVSTVFRISLFVIFIPVLIFSLITSIIKIMWYNKNMKTRVIDWIGITLCFIVLIASVFLYLKEDKLENAVYDVIEEKVGNKSFTIEFIDEMESEENYFVVSYTIEGENTK
ncbi:hypothetical protein [Gracilibacillus sp. YIM 98692]|uniref:hypothetical protein n=1 Tax=Gracilibacillus sp. YIM 98692 TaxID=2663532 RepID=UPI0013D8DFDF|nr:hypothetical protein [Gracilibacillus sp. YIM 98692]